MKLQNLQWTKVLEVTTYVQALKLAEEKKAEGWRLPTFQELDSALYHDVWRKFVICPKVPIWSLAGDSGQAWIVTVDDFSKYEMPIHTDFNAAVMLVKDI
jgi:hypothetical protein